MNFKEILPATGRDIPIEFRLFETSLGITLLILYFYTIFGAFFGYQWPVMTIYTAASAIYTGLYVAQKRGFPFRALTLIYYLVAFILLALAWLPSGGLRGAITNMFVLIFVSGLLILHPRDFLIFVIVSLIMVAGYTVLENSYPSAAAPYASESQWMIDISVSNLIMLSVLGFTVYVFKREYLRDKDKLKITNGKLEEEKVKAEMAGRAKSLFLASISHEMRTPLNGIAGSSELLRQTEMSKSQKQILANLSYSNDLLNGLISDVLDITMMEGGHLEIQENEFSMQSLVENVVQVFQPKLTAVKDHVFFNTTIDKQIPPILKGDVERLRRILVHLINNSVKFTHQGSIGVSVTQTKRIAELCTVRFEIEDTGIGISKQNQKHIFESIQNFSGGEGENGIGLGLNICKRLIEAMGGKMEFNSTDGKGSLFYFEIPLKVKDSDESVSHDLCLKQLKVLIAEDQQINQVITKKMLQNMGVGDIDIAENGLEAVAKNQAKHYDLILMDLRMPIMDGLEATQEILLNASNKPVIIAVTANALEIDKEKCMGVGMLDFINKPFTKEILNNSIQKTMKMRVPAES